MHDTITKNIWENSLLINKRQLYSLSLISSIPFKRSVSSSVLKVSINKPESLAIEHINSGEPTTSLVINKILLNQELSVTDNKLEQLLKVQGVEIDLPIVTVKGKNLLAELTGKSKYKGYSGVYFFTHRSSGLKYVGSSNLLRRRMDYYFKGDFPAEGKFLPLLKKEGLGAFKLKIFKLNIDKFNNLDALILEQYFLLSKEFDLNYLRVVNMGSSKGEGVYVYDLSCSILYYHAKSRIDLKRVLKIHTETSKIYVDSKIPYLNNFLLLSHPIPTASKSGINVQELVEKMQKERQNTYTLGIRRSIPVTLEIKEGNTFVASSIIGHTLNFDSLTSCTEYLREVGLIIKRSTLAKYLKIGKVFHNFLCKYSSNILPGKFKEVGLIIDEYKKLKGESDSESLIVNKKNKSLLVKKENFEKEFESIMSTVEYFRALGIKLDRKTLNVCLKDGKEYRGYYFSYK